VPCSGAIGIGTWLAHDDSAGADPDGVGVPETLLCTVQMAFGSRT